MYQVLVPNAYNKYKITTNYNSGDESLKKIFGIIANKSLQGHSVYFTGHTNQKKMGWEMKNSYKMVAFLTVAGTN